MNKKMLLLALGGLSAVMLTLPTMASALTPVHTEPTPIGTATIGGGTKQISLFGGSFTHHCVNFHGSATWQNGTLLSIKWTGGKCTTSLGGTCTSAGQPSGNIETTTLPAHLVTLANNKPGVLVTPGASEHFATFTCVVFGIPVVTEIKGNGLVGTITSPSCGVTSNSATIDFNATAHGVQEHTKIAGTETVYRLKKGGEIAALDATVQVALGSESKLNCT